MFDGSSIAGWKGIDESDMILMPDPGTAVMDIFIKEPTLIIRCDVVEPPTMKGYERDPRSLAKRALGLPEDARASPTPPTSAPRTSSSSSTACATRPSMSGTVVQRRVERSGLELGKELRGRNSGHRPGRQGRLFPRAPGRFAARHPLRDVHRARADGPQGRGAPPRGGHRRPVRDRRAVRRL